MAFQLQHPEHAALECEECKRFVYQIDTAQPWMKAGKRVKAPKNYRTPCEACPKGSPERYEQIRLTARSAATLDLYRATRAMGGRNLTDAEASDELLAIMFSILDRLFTAKEQATIRSAVVDVLSVTGSAASGSGTHRPVHAAGGTRRR